MEFLQMNTDQLLQKLRDGDELSLRHQIELPFLLSLPAILAQVSSIVMQYIDASMVGSLGPNDSAAIGLVSTSTWLFGGVCTSIGTGFTVQVAHKIGGGEPDKARAIMKLGFLVSIGFSSVFSVRQYLRFSRAGSAVKRKYLKMPPHIF